MRIITPSLRPGWSPQRVPDQLEKKKLNRVYSCSFRIPVQRQNQKVNRPRYAGTCPQSQHCGHQKGGFEVPDEPRSHIMCYIKMEGWQEGLKRGLLGSSEYLMLAQVQFLAPMVDCSQPLVTPSSEDPTLSSGLYRYQHATQSRRHIHVNLIF